MKIKAILFLFLLSLLLLFSSCSTSGKYGSRNAKYTEARIKSKSNYSHRFQKLDNVTVPSKGAKIVQKNDVATSNNSMKSAMAFQKRNELIAQAVKHIGTPYKYSGKTPDEGFDCSGFANYVFQQQGMHISGPSYELALLGDIKDRNDISTGDLIFFGESGRINHVGIVTENKNGNLYFIHSSTSSGIIINEVFSSDYWRSRFLFGRDVIEGEFKNL